MTNFEFVDITAMNLVTPKAAVKLELLFNKLASGFLDSVPGLLFSSVSAVSHEKTRRMTRKRTDKFNKTYKCKVNNK